MGTTTTLGRAQRVETRTVCEENCIVRANGWRQCYQAPAAAALIVRQKTWLVARISSAAAVDIRSWRFSRRSPILLRMGYSRDI
jgi:hypothetical protein